MVCHFGALLYKEIEAKFSKKICSKDYMKWPSVYKRT